MTHLSVADALETRLRTAAAVMTAPKCNNVTAGEPTAASSPVIAYWFSGIQVWDANTLDRTQEQWGWHIRIYLPLGTRITPARRDAELWIATLCSAIRAELWSHVALGGQATGKGVDVGDWTTGYTDVAGITCRIADMDWGAQMANVSTIGA